MVVENKYLRKAVEKAGFVVLVKQYKKGQEGSKLEYISPNAKLLGMNVELLNKGMRLTEDYIFPEDRVKVMKVIQEVMETGLDDYEHSFRIVGDDGELRKISARVTLDTVDASEGVYNFELCIQDVTHKKEESTVRSNEKYVPKFNGKKMPHNPESIKFTTGADMASQMKRLEQMMTMFANMTELYSVYMDVDGKYLLPPVGPVTNMGDFYDLFQTPVYKEYYKKIQKMVLDENAPMVIERQEGGDGRLSAAPIYMNEELLGFWVLGSYTPDETEKLKDVCENQWQLAKIMSSFVYQSVNAEIEAAKAKGAGKKLREELAKQNIINVALTKINSKLNTDLDQVVGETLREVSLNLRMDKIFLYTMSTTQVGFKLRSFYDVSGEAPGEDAVDVLPENTHIMLAGLAEGERFCMADNSNMTETSKINLMRHGFRASVAYPIRLNGKLYGSMIFAECKAERVWTKEELRFMQSISLIVQNMIENADGDENVRNVNKHLIETYNNFNVGVFVKDTFTGEVLFSNKVMNDMIGRDFVGEDSRNILRDLRDRFDNMGGIRNTLKERKIQNWCSYIQEVDAIMDITEVPIEWLQGEDASLIILRKAKEN